MDTINSVEELERAVGKDALFQEVEDVLRWRYPEVLADGTKLFEESWDWNEAAGLEDDVAEIIASQKVYHSPSDGFWYTDISDDGIKRKKEREFAGIEGRLQEYRAELVEFSFMGLDSSDSVKGLIADVLEWEAERYWAQDASWRFWSDIAEEIESQAKDMLEQAGFGEAEVDIDVNEWADYLSDEHKAVWETGITNALGNVELRANIGICTGKEWNRDYTNICVAARDVLAEKLYEAEDGEAIEFDKRDKELIEDNSLTWLLATQGESWASYIDRKDEENPGRFLASVREELANTSYDMTQLTVLAKMTVDQYARLICGEQNFEVDPGSKGFTMGLFDKWNGGGSQLGIEPTTPFTIGAENVRSVSPECGRSQPCWYNVDEVFGLTSGCWSDCLSETEKEPYSVAHEGVDYEAIAKSCEDAAARAREERAAHQAAARNTPPTPAAPKKTSTPAQDLARAAEAETRRQSHAHDKKIGR